MANDYREVEDDVYNADEVYQGLKKSIRGQWQSGGKMPYGQRYPDNASATESNVGMTVATRIALAKKRDQKIEQIYGHKVNGIDSRALLQNTLTEMLKVQRKLLRIMDEQFPLGQVNGYSFQLRNIDPMMHIDFVEASEGDISLNIPANANISVPGRLLYALHIFNDGTGTITFSSNLSESRFESSVILKPGESFKLEYKWPIIKTLNLKTIIGVSDIRLIAMY